jgi:UDP-GlcNAc:undecaprenyl-phosphate GlcNAc-1-phosphate transferase
MGMLAFVVGLFVAVCTTPYLRRLAVSTGFIDKPGDHKSHHIPVPYLGGVGIILGVLTGMLVTSSVDTEGAVIVAGAVVLGTVGLVDDRRTVDLRIRLVLELGMAAIAVGVGMRLSLTGVTAIDALLTLTWIVGITNAFNLLDNMDGLASGVAAAGAGGVLVLAVLGHRHAAVGIAAAVIGACLGFLVYNRRPASIFMGDTGSLFLGFVLAILVMRADPALGPPRSAVVPLLLMGVPALDTATVTMARLRRRRPVSLGGKDHLSHRLVALGVPPGPAVCVLVGVEAAVAALAIAADRGLMPTVVALLAGAALLGGFSFAIRRAPVYEEAPVGWPRWLPKAFGAGVAAMVLLAAPAALALASAERPLKTGMRLTTHALASTDEVASSQRETTFARAGASFRQAHRRLDAPLTSLGLGVPGVSSNLSASRELVSIGAQLADAGAQLSARAKATLVEAGSGASPASVAGTTLEDPTFEHAAEVVRRCQDRLTAIKGPYLLPSLRQSVDELGAQLQQQLAAARVGR